MNSTQTSMQPGAQAGQIILLVEMSMVEPVATLDLLKDRGYAPEIRQCNFKTGERPVAILKDEQFDPSLEIDDEYLMDEWLALGEAIKPDAVRLWRGHPKQQAIAA